MSPRESHDDRLRNVAIPGRLVDDPDEALEPDTESPEDFNDEEEEFDDLDPKPEPAASGSGGRSIHALLRLYRGETRFDFVGRRRWWFLISGLIIVAGLASFSVRGFNFGIDFKGGTSWQIAASGVSQSKVTSAVEAAGLTQPTVEILGGRTVEVQGDLNSLPTAQQHAVEAKVQAAVQKFAPNQPVSINQVGPTWGSQITEHALIALIAFFVAVGVYISLRFEPKMAIAAFIALIHDLLVTAGVYSLLGFQVTPDTVVAILTILGYSLYDTVVVFDRVRDNTRGLGSSGRMTYSEMINLSMNQTLARSINTSLVAIMPVFAVLVIGAEVLGAVTLQNYGLALFVGLLSGAYSSIFIASPILALFKEREHRYTVIRQRLSARSDRSAVLTPAAAALLVGAASGGSRQGGASRAGRSGPLRPGAARSARTPISTGAGGRPAARPAAGAAKATPGGSRPAAQQRPAARPRKGAKRGGKKRR